MPRPDGRVLSVCTLVYTQTLYYSTPFLSPSSPFSDDVHPLRAALHTGRRLSAHVLCGGQKQVPPPPAAQGAGSGCTVTNSVQQDIPSVPVECAVCVLHILSHTCVHGSLASTTHVGDTKQTSVCCTVLSLLVWQY